MNGNSIIPTDAEHDDHHAHRCVECGDEFTAKNPVWEETPEGDICEECAEERPNQEPIEL